MHCKSKINCFITKYNFVTVDSRRNMLTVCFFVGIIVLVRCILATDQRFAKIRQDSVCDNPSFPFPEFLFPSLSWKRIQAVIVKECECSKREGARGASRRRMPRRGLDALVLPGKFLVDKLTGLKKQQQEQSRRKVTERELAHLHHKIVSIVHSFCFIFIQLWFCKISFTTCRQ